MFSVFNCLIVGKKLQKTETRSVHTCSGRFEFLLFNILQQLRPITWLTG